MEKDIKIKETETKSVQSVSYEELYVSLRDKFRIIEKINLTFPNDNDFGRNIRKLLKHG